MTSGGTIVSNTVLTTRGSQGSDQGSGESSSLLAQRKRRSRTSLICGSGGAAVGGGGANGQAAGEPRNTLAAVEGSCHGQASASSLGCWYRQVVNGRRRANSGATGKGAGGESRRARDSMIANASSNFVGKLAHMIKKSNTLTRDQANLPDRGPEPAIAEEKGNESIGGSSGNRYLLGEFSRRLVRRCTRTRAAQFVAWQAGRGSGAGGSSGTLTSGDNRRDSKLAGRHCEPTDSKAGARDERARTKQISEGGATSRSSSKSLSSSSMATVLARTERQAPEQRLEQERQQQQSNLSASNLTSSRQINSSISTLSTTATPSGCCFCDESSSSGFISASGINCSDSTTTHSCSSSTYNDHQPVGYHQQQQQQQQQQNYHHHQLLPESARKPETGEEEEASATGALTSDKSRPANLVANGAMPLASGLQQTAPAAGREAAKKVGAGGASSLLSRARNSTINLASLATVTQSFNYSASVGNLWSSQSHQSRRELAELIGEMQGVKPLDYSVRGQFDAYEQASGRLNTNNDDINNNTDPKLVKGQANKSLLGVAGTNLGRKLSSKDKKKRQKDAEKVEKLRLLVSYLRSGTSQQLLSPVALEADEIELAERYKLQLILCEDCLQAVEQQQTATCLSSSPISSVPMLNFINATGDLAISGSRIPDTSRSSSDQLDTTAGIVINVRRSSDQTSSGQSQSLSVPSSSLSSSPQPLSTSHTGTNLSASHNFQSVSSPSIDESHLQSGRHSPSSATSQQSLQHKQQPPPQSLDQAHQLLCYRCNKPTGRSKTSARSSMELAASGNPSSNMDSTLSTFRNQHSGAQNKDYNLQQQLMNQVGYNLHNYSNNSYEHRYYAESSSTSIHPQHDHDHHHCHSHHSHHHQYDHYHESNEKRDVQGGNHERAFLSSCRSMPSESCPQNSDHRVCSANRAEHTRTGSSNPQIGNVSWILRRSSSDPGKANHLRLINSNAANLNNRLLGAGCDRECAEGSYSSCSTGQGTDRITSRRNSNFQSPKLFYIDDIERKDSDGSENNSQLATLPSSSPQYDHFEPTNGNNSGCQRSKGIISSNEAIKDLADRSWSSDLFLSSTPTAALPTITGIVHNSKVNAAALIENQPTAGANNNDGDITSQTETSGGSLPETPTIHKSAWTNPQNLATWIDNEVNSLVNDLEAKSQLVKSVRNTKSRKRKWLSSSNNRRNSSGAYST